VSELIIFSISEVKLLACGYWRDFLELRPSSHTPKGGITALEHSTEL